MSATRGRFWGPTLTKADLDARILIFAPVGRDGALLYQLAEQNGHVAETCPDLSSLAQEFRKGAGVILITEEGLALNGMVALAAAVEDQPAWSDVPFLVLVSSGDADGRLRASSELMRPLRNVTAIERPVRPQTVLVAIEAALRARKRQIALRDALDDLQASQSRLTESEARYRTLTEAIPQLIWSAQDSGSADYFSSQWQSYTGLPEEKLLGDRWLLTLHPDDRPRAVQAWQEAVSDRATYAVDYRIRRHDGAFRWFHTRGAPTRDGQGHILRWNGTCTDIHERVLAEEALELANQVGASLAADLDVDRIVDTLVKASTEATGAQFGAFFYNVEDESGESYMLFSIAGVPRDEFEKFPMPRKTPIFAPTFDGVGVVRSDDITLDERYGQVDPHFGMPPGHLPVRSYLAIPVISREGEVLGGLFFGHAKTSRFSEAHERVVVSFAAQAAIALDNARLYQQLRGMNRNLEERVEERTEKLQNAVRELEGFTHSVSHDMRTPLRAMIGHANIILEDYGDEVSQEARGHLERISGAALKMSTLVEDLLGYARLGRRDVRRDEIDMTELAGAVVSVVREETGIQIDARIKPGMHALGDLELLRMVFHNLVGNAVKYHPHNRPLILEIEEENGEFSVRDNGIGFDMAYAGKLFVPFERLHRDSEYPGTGIGLANVKRIIERHGGTVRAEGEPGVGSVFRFTLE
ncbi:PAS domain S-box protein [bacterium]|nr:MAG: PAS domain S-box protein [bacterium]